MSNFIGAYLSEIYVEKQTSNTIVFRGNKRLEGGELRCDDKRLTFSFKSFNVKSFIGCDQIINADAVVVDENFMLSPKKKDEIYRNFGPIMVNPKFFIFIG